MRKGIHKSKAKSKNPLRAFMPKHAFGMVLFLVCFLLSASTSHAFIHQEKVAISKALAHYTMGQIYDLLGMIDRAVLEYEKASYFDESSYLIYLRKGIDYARLNMLQEAKDSLNLVDQLNPEDLQSHYLLALIYSTEQDYESAGKEYELILKSASEDDPQNIEIYGYLGQLYYSQRKYDQAISQFEKILSFEPSNVDVMYLLGSLYSEANRYDDAVTILKDALKIEAEHDGCLNTLGYLYAEKGVNLKEAEALIKKALELDSDNGAYLDSLGWVYFKMEKFQQALEMLKKADQTLKDPVIYDHMGDVYIKLNQKEEAMRSWEKSLELVPDQEQVKKKIEEIKSIQAHKAVKD